VPVHGHGRARQRRRRRLPGGGGSHVHALAAPADALTGWEAPPDARIVAKYSRAFLLVTGQPAAPATREHGAADLVPSYYAHNVNQRQLQKTQTRQRIVRSAVDLLKRRGLTDATVSDVMSGAGLTVGGFYAHFPSKNVLAEEAVREALAERRRLFLERSDQDGWRPRLESALREYFSPRHRDDRAGGCPMPTASIEAAQNRTAATVFVEELTNMAEAFETGRDPASPRAPREAALGCLALMVGGMILARAVEGTPLSDEILMAATRFGTASLHQFEEAEEA
jgi:TetR/AcrR family transcriptional repressor of nem operon